MHLVLQRMTNDEHNIFISHTAYCLVLDGEELPPTEGSCVAAGYNNSDTCCSSGFCAGNPVTCSCDLECYRHSDCCDDISDSCTEGLSTLFSMHIVE